MALTVPTLLVILYLPGYLVLRRLAVLRMQALAAAPAVGSAMIGTLVVVYHVTGLPWNLLTAALGAVVLVGAAVGAVRLMHRFRPPRFSQTRTPIWWPVIIAVGLAFLISAQAMLRGFDGLDTPMQASDGVWHLNAAAYVRQDQNAYPVGSLAPMYWGQVHYYPTGWHALVAILPADVPTAANLVALFGACLVWCLGCASLLSACVPPTSRRIRDALPLLSGIIASAIATAPFVLLTTLWPYGWSVCLLPGVIALLLVARPQRGYRRGSVWPLGGIVAVVLAAMGAAFVHGASVFNLAVLGVPAMLLVLLHEVRRRWRQGGRSRSALIGVAVVVCLGLLAGGSVFADQLVMLARFTRPGAMLGNTMLEAWRDSPMISAIPDRGMGASGLSALSVLGALVALATHRHRWAALCAPLALVILAASVMTHTPLSILASPWYMQKARILPLLEIPVLVLAATAVEWLCAQARSRTGRLRLVAAALSVAAPILLVVNTLGREGIHERVTAVAYQPARSAWTVMLAPGEADFIRRSAELIPEDAMVLGQPTNGSAYYWSLTGRQVVYPSLRPYAEPDRRYVSGHAAMMRVDPQVCQALDRLGAHYYYTDADRSEAQAPAGGKTPQWPNQLNFVPESHLTPVATDGTHTLWLISGCGWTS